ncbi:MAG: hypothetical protein ACPL7O_00035 [Armatimonadota bacterium]
MGKTISERVIRVFRLALEILNSSEIPYVVGGAYALHFYTGVYRDTHDLDIYLEEKYVQKSINALSSVGFKDYGEMAPGDRDWIYHAVKRDVLVDLIWQPPNGLHPVDESFYARGPVGEFAGVPVRFLPPDELAWAKVFTLNRHRCDWPDLFSLIRSSVPGFDWYHLLQKMDDHWPLLLAFVIVYDWAYPAEAYRIPNDIRLELLRRKAESPMPESRPTREVILDPWIHTRD